MYKLTLFLLCLAFLAAAGGFVGLGMALGMAALGSGVLALVLTGGQILTR